MMGNPSSWADNNKKCNRFRRKRAADHFYNNKNHRSVHILPLLKNQTLYSEARVLRLGPTFMSIYIPNLAIERRIYYDEVEGLTVEWLDATSTLLLGRSMHERPPNMQIQPGRCRQLEDIAALVNPVINNDSEIITYSSDNRNDDGGGGKTRGLCGGNLEPLFFPLTLHLKSTVPVALHAVGRGDGPRDIVARLYVTSYFQ